eukprot:TRINITY_DN13150_c0_g1_i1.p3 TRINITY_DN13150_c0_g1~~TRINITY_DN13150_c0_g1_i1.p3  ORF type:complete len:236 (-),score=54.10 TRINITY_DN13150_c0_g1_i1:265-972(-)
MNKVLTQQLKLQGSKWDSVSPNAKDLVKSMMNRDVEARVDSMQALAHPWFKQFEFELKGSKEIEQVVMNMSRCIPQKRLGQATWIFLVNYLLGREEKTICELVFEKWDQDRDGKVSREELVEGFCECMSRSRATKEVDRLMGLIDTDGNGTLEYSEFLAAAVDRKVLLSDKKLRVAFNILDRDGSELISIGELKEVFGGDGLPDYAWKEIIDEVDENGDGEISYQEFKEMMRKFA